MAKKNGFSAIKFIGTAAAGAVVGALAIRAMDKYVLKREEKKIEALEEQQHQPQPMLAAPTVHPVFMPVMPTIGAPIAPLPMPSPPPLSPPTRNPVPPEEVSIVDQIEEEWEN